MGNIGFLELLLILAIALLLFGARRLPEMAQSLGKSIRIFKKAMTEEDKQEKEEKEKDSEKKDIAG